LRCPHGSAIRKGAWRPDASDPHATTIWAGTAPARAGSRRKLRSPIDVEREDFLFIEEVLRGVKRSLADLGWSVLITFLRDSDPAGAYQQLQRVSAEVDGMIIAEDIVG
jgi:hypothetical protein